jgi:hypothetical protein
MKKYKLDNEASGADGLNDKDINKHKDFKKLMANYEKVTDPLYKRPLYKNPKIFIALLLILLIIYLLLAEF